jgi:hypothetical protein
MSDIIAAIVGAVLGAVFATFQDDLRNWFGSTDRRLSGLWHGTASDVSVPGHLEYEAPLSYEVQMKLDRRGRRIRGTVTIKTSQPLGVTEAKMQGLYVMGDFVALSYRLTDADASHFGVVILQALGTGRQMSGFFLSKKLLEQRIGFGRVELTKQLSA